MAQYYCGKLNALDDVLCELAGCTDVTVLARGAAQGAHYRNARFEGIRVVDTALDIKEIAVDCDPFVAWAGL